MLISDEHYLRINHILHDITEDLSFSGSVLPSLFILPHWALLRSLTGSPRNNGSNIIVLAGIFASLTDPGSEIVNLRGPHALILNRHLVGLTLYRPRCWGLQLVVGLGNLLRAGFYRVTITAELVNLLSGCAASTLLRVWEVVDDLPVPSLNAFITTSICDRHIANIIQNYNNYIIFTKNILERY